MPAEPMLKSHCVLCALRLRSWPPEKRVLPENLMGVTSQGPAANACYNLLSTRGISSFLASPIRFLPFGSREGRPRSTDNIRGLDPTSFCQQDHKQPVRPTLSANKLRSAAAAAHHTGNPAASNSVCSSCRRPGTNLAGGFLAQTDEDMHRRIQTPDDSQRDVRTTLEITVGCERLPHRRRPELPPQVLSWYTVFSVNGHVRCPPGAHQPRPR
jgi:hypothetical protein